MKQTTPVLKVMNLMEMGVEPALKREFGQEEIQSATVSQHINLHGIHCGMVVIHNNVHDFVTLFK